MIEIPFADSNILIYTLGQDESKTSRANELLQQGLVISTQVLGETANVALSKLGLSSIQVHQAIHRFHTLCDVVRIDIEVLANAISIYNKYRIIHNKLSFWDSLIVSSALRVGCKRIYTEDKILLSIPFEDVTIQNPFVRA